MCVYIWTVLVFCFVSMSLYEVLGVCTQCVNVSRIKIRFVLPREKRNEKSILGDYYILEGDT